jgi:hypothetical protein
MRSISLSTFAVGAGFLRLVAGFFVIVFLAAAILVYFKDDGN